jgi:hypothetical protein
VASIAMGLMTVSFAITVGCTFVTVRLYSVLPVSLHWLFAAVSLLAPILTNILLPEGIKVFEDSSQTLKCWKLKLVASVITVDKKYRSRKLRALRPCRIHVGLNSTWFFHLKKSTLSTFYNLSLYHTMNALISVPV